MKNEIINSWDVNAKEWINLIEKQGILSRKVTNPAIINIIEKYAPEKMLDLGCGEGWLTRALSAKGFNAFGADAIDDLVLHARKSGNEEYFQLSYRDIIAGTKIPFQPFDAVVFNFSLYEANETEDLLKQIKSSLNQNGLLFIQTLHPFSMIKNGLPYKSQWMDNAWKGLKGAFKAHHSWYYRTLEDWLSLFNSCGWHVRSIREPLLSDDKPPASIIFVLDKFSYETK